MAAVGLVVFTATSMVGLALLRGLVLQALWLWFVSEPFAVAELTLPTAIGLSLLVSFLTYQWDARDSDYAAKPFSETVVEGATAGLLMCGLAYLVGAIVHSFA